MELSKLKPGDAVVTGRIVKGDEANLRIQKVTKTTHTQVVLDNTDRYAIDTGAKIGSRSGVRILRLATKADFEHGESERQKREQFRKEIKADRARRDELASLFPDRFRPAVRAPSSDQPEQFNLEFYNVHEQTIRRMAELLKGL